MGRKRSAASKLVVQREPLATRALSVLEEELNKGVWGDVLPSERKLASSLQISRMTLRQALKELARRGTISSGRGKRRQILAGSASNRIGKFPAKVVLLAPLSIQEMEPQTVLMIHHLSEWLLQKEIRLEVEARPSCFSRRPAKALARLTEDLHPEGWIVFRGSQIVQDWFHRKGLPFVILGSTFLADSPSFGSQHTAVSAHAAAQFIRLGHLRGAILMPRHETIALSDIAIQEGFEQAGFPCKTLFHDRTRKGIIQAVESALALRPRVTALFSIGGQYSLTVLSSLMHRGIRLPEEMSLIVMGNDPAFPYLFPSPAHYESSIEKATRQLFRLVCRVVLQGDSSRSHVELLPEFIPGESLAAAPQPLSG